MLGSEQSIDEYDNKVIMAYIIVRIELTGLPIHDIQACQDIDIFTERSVYDIAESVRQRNHGILVAIQCGQIEHTHEIIGSF